MPFREFNLQHLCLPQLLIVITQLTNAVATVSLLLSTHVIIVRAAKYSLGLSRFLFTDRQGQ
jgi:hypothetical protein